ncbi:MAG: hypothetical protein JNK58_01660 [Phycisphaerae bacterium]|nr:hypothetical protein [Phycisphaerae bacterium]
MRPTNENIPTDLQQPTPTTARRPLTLDVGPVVSLSFWVFMGWVVLAATGVCIVAAAVTWFWSPSRVWSVLPAGASVVLGQASGMLAARPWKKRHLGRWPMAWLLGRGVALLGLFASAALLYSATRPDPLVFGLVVASAFFVSLLAEVWAYTLQVKERTGSGAR